MKHLKIRTINFLTTLIVLLILFGLLLMGLWAYPRKIVTPTTTQTTATEYRVGDTIYVKGYTEVFVEARVDNLVHLQCGAASYLVRTVSLPTTKMSGEYNFAIGEVPQGVNTSPPRCKVSVLATYHVKFFLGLERTYEVEFTSNEFDIKE